ncbi:MAG TPA: 50S ribosomal protein L29 [Dehalococcoidia bacterium]|nr:50S ribosomal protein L29 [Dehalococcoidia bacterium]
MKIQDVRALSNDQLTQELDKSYREVMNLRFRAATNQLPNTNLPRAVRKDIARMLMVMRERELARS